MAGRAWREAQHPRREAGPGGGQFISKAGWAAVASASIGSIFKPTRGRDVRGELDYEKLAARVRSSRSEAGGDLALGDIYDMQGYHGRPLLASPAEMDALVRAGHTEMFRGIADADRSGPLAGLTGADFATQFRKGDEHHPGLGMHGNGSYATTWELEARGYSDPNDVRFLDPALSDSSHWPGVVRIALPPDARVITQERLRGLHSAELAERRTGESHRVTEARRQVFADAGRFAAAMGYDAIDLGPMSTAGAHHIPGRPASRNHYILLNRSILTVQQ